MRTALIVTACLAFVVAGCGGSSGKQTVSTDTTASGSTTIPSPGSSTGPDATTTTVELSTTSLPCQPIPIPTTPVASPVAGAASMLTDVQELGDSCVDHVIFDLPPRAPIRPATRVTYGTPPFSQRPRPTRPQPSPATPSSSSR